MELRADQDIVREGDRPTRSCLILEGFACTFKMTGDGKRQILGFHIAGDIPETSATQVFVSATQIGSQIWPRWPQNLFQSSHDGAGSHARQ